MGGFNGFSSFAQGLGNGYAGGAASAAGAMQNLVMQMIAEKKRRQMFDDQQAQARSLSDANLAQKREEDATKRLDLEERGAEKGLRLAPIPETSEMRNARVASKGAEALDVKRSGDQLLPEQANALRATSSLGGVLGAPASLMTPRAVGQRWERDAALAGPAKPQPWKKGAAYDIEDQAMQAVKSKFGTQALMDAITSNALLPPDQRQDMGAIMQEWRDRQGNQSAEIGKAARGMVDYHEQAGDLSPDEANRLRTLYASRWAPQQPSKDQGAPAGGATASSAPPPSAVPTNPDEHKAQLDAAGTARSQADALQAKLDSMPSQSNIGAGEAESDGDDTPAGEGDEAGSLGRNMNAAFDSLRNDSPSTTSSISNAMQAAPDLRSQIVNRNTPNPNPTEGVMADPMDDIISQMLQRHMNQQPRPQGMPVIPPSPQLDPFIKSMVPPPTPISSAFQAQQGPQQQPQPFIPPFRQRPGFSGPPMLPPGPPAMTPTPPQSPFAGLGGRAMGMLGLGGLGMPGASAMPQGQPQQPIAPPSSMPSMFSPPAPQQFQQSFSQAPHFPRDNELQHFNVGGRQGALTPDAAQAFAKVMMDPSLTAQQRAILGQFASTTRSPEQQDMMAARRQLGDFTGLATDSQGNPVPAPFAPATPPRSGHLAGSGMDMSKLVAQDPALMALLQQNGWRRPLGEGDPVHWEYRQQW